MGRRDTRRIQRLARTCSPDGEGMEAPRGYMDRPHRGIVIFERSNQW